MADERVDLISPGTEFHDCDDCPTMVVIPAGQGLIGSTAEEAVREGVPVIGKMDIAAWERPQRLIAISKPFALARAEVTTGQFSAFVRATGYRPEPGCNGDVGGRVRLVDEWSWANPGFEQDSRHPVVCVNWYDAHAYVAWLSRITGKRYRLPTESEWEYAGRAGTRTARYWGDSREPACEYENLSDPTLAKAAPGRDRTGSPPYEMPCPDGHAYTAPVASFKPNPFGLYDMIGNVREWVEDCFDRDHSRLPDDGRPFVDDVVCRRATQAIADRSEVLGIVKGASYRYPPYGTRLARRGALLRDYRSINAGFRVAREIESAPMGSSSVP